MTTFSEVKQWTRPLLAADPRLVLSGRNLVLNPVGHFIRGVYIDRTGNRLRSKLIFYIHPLFAPSNSGVSFRWNRNQMPYQTDDERFEADFLDLCKTGLAELDQLNTIADFLKQAETVTSRSFGNVPISRFPLRHAEVLAALGCCEEALSILAPAMRGEEATANRILASAEAQLDSKPRSLVAKDSIAHATMRLQLVARLKPLLHLLEADDHAGVAALLRNHEHQGAKLWKVEHLWVPSPFPFEDGL